MTNLYSESDRAVIEKQLFRRRLAVYIPAGILFAATIVSFIPRVKWLTLLLGLICGIVMIFGIDYFIRPFKCYDRLILGALRGRSHDVDSVFVSVSPDTSVVEGVRYRSITVLAEKDKHGDPFEHEYYWDIEKELPAFDKGSGIRIRYHDRTVIGWELI